MRVLLCILLVFLLVSCGDIDGSSDSSGSNNKLLEVEFRVEPEGPIIDGANSQSITATTGPSLSVVVKLHVNSPYSLSTS